MAITAPSRATSKSIQPFVNIQHLQCYKKQEHAHDCNTLIFEVHYFAVFKQMFQ